MRAKKPLLHGSFSSCKILIFSPSLRQKSTSRTIFFIPPPFPRTVMRPREFRPALCFLKKYRPSIFGFAVETPNPLKSMSFRCLSPGVLGTYVTIPSFGFDIDLRKELCKTFDTKLIKCCFLSLKHGARSQK
eukprot:NODE_12_length_54577_cov_0.384100.p29 type:complete len:132 gc:universal NODE_12_length_54577_cov_0.384100:29424-29029(-)